MNIDDTPHDEWWLATLGNTLIWARLRIREAGTAEVLDSDGKILPYDSPDTAHAALMDAEFVSWNGLDEEDALERGFSMTEIEPPSALHDEALIPHMVRKLGTRA